MNPQRIAVLCGVLAGVVASGGLTGCASTQGGNAGKAKNVDWLFVQNSDGLSTSGNRIVLRGVNPQTICFSDRPDRVAGHMKTAAFVPMWSQGSDSFLKDPPNATLSVLKDGKVESTVVTLRNPKLSGGDLSYEVTVLEGSLPKRSGAASLFIDVIGMPYTPASYAGAARRAVYQDAALAPAPLVVATPVYAPTVVHYGAYGGTAVRSGAYGSTAVRSGPYGETAVHRGAYGTTVVRRR